MFSCVLSYMYVDRVSIKTALTVVVKRSVVDDKYFSQQPDELK